MSILITINNPEIILAFIVLLAALQMVCVPARKEARSKEQGEVKFFVNNNKTNK